jgi:hypothetical protein
MDLQAALLCAHATVHEGRLSVLDAGTTHFTAARFPMSFAASLALMLNADAVDQERLHQLVASVHACADGMHDRAVASMTGEFIALGPSSLAGETVNVPMAFDLRPLTVPVPGLYELHVTIDEELLAVLQFCADVTPD